MMSIGIIASGYVEPVLEPLLITDTFSRHPDGNLSGKVSETGETWTTLPNRTTALITSGKVKGNGSAGASYIDAGKLDCYITGTWSGQGAGAVLAGRASDSNSDRYFAELTTNSVVIKKTMSGVTTTIATYACTMTIGHVHEFYFFENSGTQISYFAGGAYLGAPLDTDSSRPMGTYYGIGSESAGSWSDFAILE